MNLGFWRILLWRWHTLLHPETFFLHLFTYFSLLVFGYFCFNYNEAHRVELSNSRNPRVSYRVDEVNSRTELSISVYYSLFIIHSKDPMMSPLFKLPSKIFESCVRVIERTLGSHKNCSCIFNLGSMMSLHSNAYPKPLGFAQRQ